jgi:hypothetical protein
LSLLRFPSFSTDQDPLFLVPLSREVFLGFRDLCFSFNYVIICAGLRVEAEKKNEHKRKKRKEKRKRAGRKGE